MVHQEKEGGTNVRRLGISVIDMWSDKPSESNWKRRPDIVHREQLQVGVSRIPQGNWRWTTCKGEAASPEHAMCRGNGNGGSCSLFASVG